MIDPTGESVAVDQALPSSDGSYSFTLEAGGTMQITGDYTITVRYGLQKATTTFYFVATTITPTTLPTTYVVDFNLGSYQPGCELTDSCLTPTTLSISVNDSVEWYNADTEPHTATSGTPATGPDGRFDSGLIIDSGGTWSNTFTQTGTYDYFSMVSPWVQGKIIVGVGDGQVIAQPNFKVETDRISYSAGDTVTIQVSGTGGSENVAVSVITPNGITLLTRTVTTNTIGIGSIDFSLSDSSSSGTYTVDGTVNISGTTLSSSDSFNVSQIQLGYLYSGHTPFQ